MKPKIVLAYSGGLDTTYCALYLSQELNYEVHAVTINTGGFNKNEITALEQKALALGVKSYTCINKEKSYYDTCIKYLVFGNVLKNNTYPLSVSAERTIQAKAIAEFALKIKAEAICHGSTGAGNDQVRFDVVFQIVAPEMQIITPIRDMKLSRQDEIDFLKKHKVVMDFDQAEYSVNQGLWGTSIGGRETLHSREYLPEEAFPSQVTKYKKESISLTFEKGELIGIDQVKFNHPTEAIKALEELASPYGIGRDIHVGDTIIGIKGRVGFEAASAIITIKAHHLLEKHTLTQKQLMVKDQLAAMYGHWLHEGLFLDPVMRGMESFFKETQNRVTGKVFVQLRPYHFILEGIESEYDLMSNEFGSYGEMNLSWTGEDVKGFSKIISNSLNIYYRKNKIDETKN